jgi:hypothetical protein
VWDRSSRDFDVVVINALFPVAAVGFVRHRDHWGELEEVRKQKKSRRRIL